MISKLRDKPGGWEIPLIKGNFATVQPKGSFSLIFTLVSTFFLLRSRNEQQQCFHSVSRLLSEKGIFLIETFKPIGAIKMDRNGQDGSLEKIYTVEQVLDTEIGLRQYRSELCYAEPKELDRMAQKAGLHLKQRWRNWRRQPTLDNDLMHISLYESQ